MDSPVLVDHFIRLRKQGHSHQKYFRGIGFWRRVSIELGYIFMHFGAFITLTDSFRGGLNLETPKYAHAGNITFISHSSAAINISGSSNRIDNRKVCLIINLILSANDGEKITWETMTILTYKFRLVRTLLNQILVSVCHIPYRKLQMFSFIHLFTTSWRLLL